MRRGIILILLLVCLLFGGFINGKVQEPDCVSSSVFDNEMRLTIVAEQTDINDVNEFADRLFRMYRENTFKSIRFSTDIMEMPDRIIMEVYLNTKTKTIEPVMSLIFNIEDDGNKYDLIVKS